MLYTLLPLLVYCGFAIVCAFCLLASNSFITDPAEIAEAAKNVKLKKLTHLVYAVALVSVVASFFLVGRALPVRESAILFLLAALVLAFLLRARKTRLPLPLWCCWVVGTALAAACSWLLAPALGSALLVASGLATERRKLTLLGAAGFAGCGFFSLLLHF
jgi:hypothetical protein